MVPPIVGLFVSIDALRSPTRWQNEVALIGKERFAFLFGETGGFSIKEILFELPDE
jgi:hypothetical protein